MEKLALSGTGGADYGKAAQAPTLSVPLHVERKRMRWSSVGFGCTCEKHPSVLSAQLGCCGFRAAILRMAADACCDGLLAMRAGVEGGWNRWVWLERLQERCSDDFSWSLVLWLVHLLLFDLGLRPCVVRPWMTAWLIN